MKYTLILLLAFLPVLLAAGPASSPEGSTLLSAPQPSTQPAEEMIGFGGGGGSAEAKTPGFHKLILRWVEDGQPRFIPFSIFLPTGYGTDNRRWPLLTFLGGLGDRGNDPGIGMCVGVPLELGRNPEIRDWMPMIVLTPQCPSQQVWDSPGISKKVLRLVHAMASRFAVDPARIYLTGFSDGGKGTWVVASEEPKLFAAAAPIVSREYQAEQTAARMAGSGITCLVISGLKDPKSEPASSRMVEELRKQNVDVVYAPVAGGEHFIWQAFYRQREFYQWLMLHRRGEAPPKDRLDGETIAKLYASREQLSTGQQIFDLILQRGLDRFEPYWFIDNCGQAQKPGFKLQLQDRRNVYVTIPLSAEVPCRLQTTRQLPKDKWTDLSLEVGHPPQGEWELLVRVNEQEQLRILINDQTAPAGWLPLNVNLHPYAGSEVRLQLINVATGGGPQVGYWAKMKLVETVPQP